MKQIYRQIQTSFWQPPTLLTELRSFGWNMVRLDYQDDVPHAIDAIHQAQECGFYVQILIPKNRPSDITAIRKSIETPVLISGPNEPDGQGNMKGWQYSAWLDAAVPRCLEAGWPLCAPAIENTHTHSLTYLKNLWPTFVKYPSVRVDIHRYAPTAWDPHAPQTGSISRADEVRRLKAIIGDRPYGVSEFGYVSPTNSEADQQRQADCWMEEYKFWCGLSEADQPDYVGAYQVLRSPTDKYGVIDSEGNWFKASKIHMVVVPPMPEPVPPEPEPPPAELPTGLTPISDAGLGVLLNFRYGGCSKGFEWRPINWQGGDETCHLYQRDDGWLAVLSPNKQEWLSIQPDGTFAGRPASAEPGAWECFNESGGLLTERPKDGLTRSLVQFDLLVNGPSAPVPQHWRQGFLKTGGPAYCPTFVFEDGAKWCFAGYTVHTMLVTVKRSLDEARALIREAKALGANTIVSLGMDLSPWHHDHGLVIDPRESGYSAYLAAYFDLLAAEGMRGAHGVLSHCQYDGFTLEDKRTLWDLTCTLAQGRWNLFLFKGKEGPDNGWQPEDLPDRHASDLGSVPVSQGSRGAGQEPYQNFLDWGCWECRRPPSYGIHKCLDDCGAGVLEQHAGYAGFPACHVPIVGIEHLPFNDVSPDQYGDTRCTDRELAGRMGLEVGSNSAGGAWLSTDSLVGHPQSAAVADMAREYFRCLQQSFYR